MFDDFGINAGFVEDLHAQYRQSPQSVEEHWRKYFASLDRGPERGHGDTPSSTNGAAAPGVNGAGASHHALVIPPLSTPAIYTNGVTSASALAIDDRHAKAALSGRVYQL